MLILLNPLRRTIHEIRGDSLDHRRRQVFFGGTVSRVTIKWVLAPIVNDRRQQFWISGSVGERCGYSISRVEILYICINRSTSCLTTSHFAEIARAAGLSAVLIIASVRLASRANATVAVRTLPRSLNAGERDAYNVAEFASASSANRHEISPSSYLMDDPEPEPLLFTS